MSTLKKVISLVLCISLLAGSFAFLGDLIMPKAAAEEAAEVDLGSKKLKTYAELNDQYDTFIYIGVEVYEVADGKLTDGKVQPGQWLEYRETVLSDLWIGNINTFYLYDNRFFDITRTSTTAGDSTLTANGYETGITSIYSAAGAHNFNADHPMVTEKVPTVGYTSSPCSSQTYFTNGAALIDSSVYTNLDQAGQVITYSATASTTALDMTKDAWYVKWYAKVLDKPAITETTTYSPYSLYKITPNAAGTMGDSRLPGNIASGAANTGGTAPARTTCKNMNLSAQFKSITFLCEDSYTNFVIEGAEHTAKFFVDGKAVSEDKYAKDAEIVVPENPSKDGYAFKGWSTDGTEAGIVTKFVMGDADVTYTAVFEELPKYTATFYVDGEAYGDPVETYVGGTINKPADPASPDGMIFRGWADTEDAAVANVTFPVAMPENGISFYAVFETTVIPTHKVTYMVNGEEYSVATANVEENADYELPEAPEFDKYTKFLGWSTIEDDADAIVTGTQTMGTADVVYYAIIEEVIFHSVTYYVDGVAYGEAVEYEENVGVYTVSEEEPAKTGYTFKGWSTVEDSKANIVSGEQTMGTEDVALYAVYEVNTYTVTFNANNGTFAGDKTTSAEDVAYGTAIAAPEADPSRVGYTFLGWAKTANATAALDDLGTMGTAAVTLYAVWSVNTYTATFYVDEAAYDNGNGTAVETKSIKYNANLVYDKLSDLAAQKPGYYFDCWVDAETGKDVPKNGSSANIKYSFASDKSFYAKWTEYPNSIVLMVRDYANGEGWIELATRYSDNTTDKINESTIKNMDIDAVMGWEGINVDIYAGWNTIFSTAPDAQATLSELTFAEGRQVYYVHKTRATFELTWKVPVFDEAGFVTENYTEVTETVEVPFTGADPFANNNVLVPGSINTTAPVGYVFDGWYDEAGEKVAFAQNKTTLSIVGGNRAFIAKYSPVEYRIVFNVNNAASSSVTKVLDTTYNLGDTVEALASGSFVDEDGNATVLPAIGMENGEQTGGDRDDGKTYYNVNGYKFAGWQIGSGANKTDFDIEKDTIELTAENIAKYLKSNSNDIVLYGVWEAMDNEAVFYYATGFDADGNAILEELVRYTVKTGEKLSDYKTAATELAKANLPAGKTFSSWTNAETNNMPAGGIEFKPIYLSEALDVYFNYNNSTKDNPLTLEDTLKKTTIRKAYYGQDIFAIREGDTESLYESIRTMTVTQTPGENYICIGWDVYTVEAGKDVYDEKNWVKVDKDAGSYVATSTLIFQANWKAYGDFFIRIYDTNHKMIKALGKDFKMYYWSSEIATDRNNAGKMNHLPDGLVILLLIPKIEGWEWEGFFDIDMWKGLSLKVEPFAVNKTFFDPRNFAQLMKTLFNFILKEIGIDVGE